MAHAYTLSTCTTERARTHTYDAHTHTRTHNNVQVENVYAHVKCVHQVYLHGTSLEPACVAVVVPEVAVLKALCEEKGINTDGKDWLKEKVRVLISLFLSDFLSLSGLSLGLYCPMKTSPLVLSLSLSLSLALFCMRQA